MTNELYHYGVKGMKWGVRRYQNYDGSWTPAGRQRYGGEQHTTRSVSRSSRQTAARIIRTINQNAKTRLDMIEDKNISVGKRHVDTCLAAGTSFKRVQLEPAYNSQYAFYATYEKHDVDKYAGLFGYNLKRRALRTAEMTEGDGREAAIENAKKMDVYQVGLKSNDRIKVASDDSATRITSKLLSDDDFKDNLVKSIQDSKESMRRPKQQALFDRALSSLEKDSSELTRTDKENIYKALNLSLTLHNESEIAVQKKFYSALQKQGYGAIPDLNDRDYSSYHAKTPMIVFDTSKVDLGDVRTLSDSEMSRLNKIYNTERIIKEIPEHATGVTKDILVNSFNTAYDSVDTYLKDYSTPMRGKRNEK